MVRSVPVAFLRPAMARPNLPVFTEAHVTRILFEGHRAVGVAPLLYRSTRPVSMLAATSLGQLARQLATSRGMLATSGVEVLAHVRSREGLEGPDLQLLLMAVLWLSQGLDAPTEHGFTIAFAGLQAESRGTVRLASADPLAPPVIDVGR